MVRLATFMYLFRAIKPIMSEVAKPHSMLYCCRNLTPFLAKIPLSRVQAGYPERHVIGRHDDISQCKIVNENVSDGLRLRVLFTT